MRTRAWRDNYRAAPVGERGVALILVMLSLLVLSVLTATIIFTARAETFASYNYKLDTQADYLAKAGIQQAIAWFRSSRYTGLTQAQATADFGGALSGGAISLFTPNTQPVQCISGCSHSNAEAQLSGFNSSGPLSASSCSSTSNYPISGSITNFCADLGSVRVTGDANNSGAYSIKAELLSYQTVNTGSIGSTNVQPIETWLITSRAAWKANSTSDASIATAEEQAVIQPIYTPTSQNSAVYGFCSVSMTGSAGTCTDAYNSALGAYAGGNNHTAAAGCDSNSTNVIKSGAGVGANGGVTLGSNVTVAGNVTLGTGAPSACGSGYTGSPASVLGQVVSGPNIPAPATPTFRTGFPSGAPSYSLGTNTTQILPESIATWPGFPNHVWQQPSIWPLGTSQPCMTGTCNGTKTNPFEIGSISMTGGGHGGNAPVLKLIGGPDVTNPVYYDINSLSQNQGQILVSGYVVLNIKTGLSIGGLGVTNGITDDVPPLCVVINYAGSNSVSIQGNGAVNAVIIAPNAEVDLGGGGSAGYMVGAIQANVVNIHGGYPVHYDTQLSKTSGGSVGTILVTSYMRRKL